MREEAQGGETVNRYEIQVLVSNDNDGPMTLIDRATLDAKNLQDAAEKYAALFVK